MTKHLVAALGAALLLASGVAGASAQMNNPTMAGMEKPPPSGPDHGMPMSTMGGDGGIYNGAPDLQAAVSLVTAGGPIGQFSIAQALTALAGPQIATAEIAKLKRQYGEDDFASFVAVQNFAINDAVAKAVAAGVTFPTPELSGATLAKRDVGLGLINGTYYEGIQLDHLVTHPIHVAVMDDIDQKFGVASDANYHKIADQAHYDLAQALGVTSVKLAAFH
jgi:hypothetical protein